MMISSREGTRHVSSWATFLSAACMVLGLALPASAALGGDLGSVQADQSQMKATIKITQSEAYAIHEMKAATGTVVREYVGQDGHVFGVTWHGPFVPDMQQILGTYFQQYSAAIKAAKTQPGRHPLNVQEPGLVVQLGGHMRSYAGRVYVPDMMPEGIKADLIK